MDILSEHFSAAEDIETELVNSTELIFHVCTYISRITIINVHEKNTT